MSEPDKPGGPVSFDRAADYYDETRAFPPGVAEQLAASVRQVLPMEAPLLELGVGTGRISTPLLEAGFRVTGIDISRRMMQRFKERLQPGGPRPGLVEGDASRLPFAAGSFEAVIAVHVLHLIPAWRQTLEEVRRVLQPGGSLLIGYDQFPEDDPYAKLGEQQGLLIQAHGSRLSRNIRRDFSDVHTALIDTGAVRDDFLGARWQVAYTLHDRLALHERRVFSSTWDVPEDIYRQVMQELRQWAIQSYGDLDQPMAQEHSFIWQRFQWI